MDVEQVTCVRCGRTPAAADPAQTWRLTWTTVREHGHDRWCCDRCARENLRSIEAQLDTEWW